MTIVFIWFVVWKVWCDVQHSNGCLKRKITDSLRSVRTGPCTDHAPDHALADSPDHTPGKYPFQQQDQPAVIGENQFFGCMTMHLDFIFIKY